MSSTPSAPLRRAAIAQLCSTSSKIQNLANVAKCASQARQSGASMLFLPECFGFIGMSSEETLKNAEPPIMEDTSKNVKSVQEYLARIVSQPSESPAEQICQVDGAGTISLLDGLRTIAKESGLWISAGGMHEAGAPVADADCDDKSERVYNSHVVLDSDGIIKALYRKIHLFDVSIPGKVSLRESSTTAPGSKLVVCDSPIGRLGLSVCYDMRFSEMYIDLVKDGAELLLMPSAFTVPTGSAHWHILLRARAIESQCYVLASAQYGRHNEKRESYGHSLAVDPWGAVLGDAGGCDEPTGVVPSIICCDIDLDYLRAIRERMPVAQHRESSGWSF